MKIQSHRVGTIWKLMKLLSFLYEKKSEDKVIAIGTNPVLK